MDYEALGRYTEATEAAHRVADELTTKLRKFVDSLGRIDASNTRTTQHVPAFDVAKLRAQFEEITGLHQALCELGREANIQAARCGRPQFTTGSSLSTKVLL